MNGKCRFGWRGQKAESTNDKLWDTDRIYAWNIKRSVEIFPEIAELFRRESFTGKIL